MRTHERAGYDCPFCLIQRGVHDERNRPADVVAVTEHAYARISPKWWPANDGAVLVIPRAHHENLYGIPTEAGHAVWDLTQQVAVAMRDGSRPPSARRTPSASPPCSTCPASSAERPPP